MTTVGRPARRASARRAWVHEVNAAGLIAVISGRTGRLRLAVFTDASSKALNRAKQNARMANSVQKKWKRKKPSETSAGYLSVPRTGNPLFDGG
jgi:hypothetical protein